MRLIWMDMWLSWLSESRDLSPLDNLMSSTNSNSMGLKVELAKARFLPGALQPRYGGPRLTFLPLGIISLVLKIYLRLPWKPLAKQMLLVARKPRGA
jgi:hypothetical protein